LLGVHAEPAKPHASRTTVESLGFNKNLKRYALQAGRVRKMIEISEKILDFEPHHRLAVVPDTTVSFSWLVATVHATPHSATTAQAFFFVSRTSDHRLFFSTPPIV
jgi:hypothetical protein